MRNVSFRYYEEYGVDIVGGGEREKFNKLLKIFDDKGINLEDLKVG